MQDCRVYGVIKMQDPIKSKTLSKKKKGLNPKYNTLHPQPRRPFPRHMPMVGSYGGVVSYEQGTPVVPFCGAFLRGGWQGVRTSCPALFWGRFHVFQGTPDGLGFRVDSRSLQTGNLKLEVLNPSCPALFWV